MTTPCLIDFHTGLAKGHVPLQIINAKVVPLLKVENKGVVVPENDLLKEPVGELDINS